MMCKKNFTHRLKSDKSNLILQKFLNSFGETNHAKKKY
jgi:hypothetical protein